jgi:glycosyltransferase involved in cell wall biosynthesis
LSSTSEGADLAGLRVCIVYDCLFPWTAGGAERWYRALAEYLPTLNANVRYLTTLQWGAANTPDIVGVEVVVVAPAAELYQVDGTRRVGPPLRFGLGVFYWLVRHRSEVDVVHVANFPFFSLIAARLALVGSGTEIYVDWHEVWPRRFWEAYAGRGAGALGFFIQELCVRLTKHALVFWSFNGERLRGHGYKGDIATLAGLLPQIPVRAASFTARLGPPTVLFVGRLIQDKGVRLLPEMLRLVLGFQPDLRLIVVGTGPEEALLRAAFFESGIADRVDWLGTVLDGELESLRSSALCSIVASTREGYGISAVESLAVGTPIVVATNPENLAVHHVAEGVNGFLVEASSVGLANGVRQVIEAGEELRISTRDWFLVHAPKMTVDGSLHEVGTLYATRATRRS